MLIVSQSRSASIWNGSEVGETMVPHCTREMFSAVH